MEQLERRERSIFVLSPVEITINKDSCFWKFNLQCDLVVEGKMILLPSQQFSTDLVFFVRRLSIVITRISFLLSSEHKKKSRTYLGCPLKQESFRSRIVFIRRTWEVLSLQLKSEVRCFSKLLDKDSREKSFCFLTVQFTELSRFESNSAVMGTRFFVWENQKMTST